MTKRSPDATPATDRPAFEITDEMIEAGLAAYLANASHDEMSFTTPRELVTLIVRAAMSPREAPLAPPPV
jgi:hypothetical protein